MASRWRPIELRLSSGYVTVSNTPVEKRAGEEKVIGFLGGRELDRIWREHRARLLLILRK